MLNQAKTIFRESNDNIRAVSGYNPERTERLLALKRMSVDMLENSLYHQMAGVTSQSQKSTTTTGVRFIDSQQTANIKPANRTIQTAPKKDALPAQVETPKQQTKATTPITAKPVYKVQIGAFRNEPNKEALAKLPSVTYEVIPGKDLKKYFAGSWDSYESAQAQVASIREAGFPDAYVVAFLNNVIIPLSQARNMK